MIQSTYFKTLLSILLVFVSFMAFAQLKLANVFTDHMVLQRNQALVFWGTASSNETVNLKIGIHEILVTADTKGDWMTSIDGLATGGPYTLSVKGAQETIILTDILVGDVWLCSGQSNMEWPLKNTDRADSDIPKANFPQIRHFEVKKDLAFSPKDEILPAKWEVANPETVGDFTAVGYYFAKHLNAELGVPIGLLHSSWGGSHVETWISKGAMKNSDEMAYYVDQIPNNWSEDSIKLEKNIVKRIYGNSAFDIQKVNENDYFKSNYDFGKWLNIGVPGQWDWQGFSGYRGDAFMYKSIELEEEFNFRPTTFSFGQNTGSFELFINGKLIAKGFYPEGISIALPAGVWEKGRNDILLGVSQQANDGVMGFWGSKDDFKLTSDQKVVLLANEPWQMIPRWNRNRHYAKWMNNSGSLCYNAMIAPLTNFAIKGAIWYQGESNAGRANQYRESFPLMIENWRKDWGYDFPFLFVQLSSYGPMPSSNEGSNWAELREAQTMTLKLPKTGMAVTTDIGNPNDIHPRNKLDVGDRLAKSALKMAYGKSIVGNGPMYKSMLVKKGKAILSFEDIGSGLMVKDKYGYLQGFEVAGADQEFFYAQATIEGDKVIVSHPLVAKPAAVRYGWTNSPIDANLYNKEGFPASPFRTDQWRGVTEGVKF